MSVLLHFRLSPRRAFSPDAANPQGCVVHFQVKFRVRSYIHAQARMMRTDRKTQPPHPEDACCSFAPHAADALSALAFV